MHVNIATVRGTFFSPCKIIWGIIGEIIVLRHNLQCCRCADSDIYGRTQSGRRVNHVLPMPHYGLVFAYMSKVWKIVPTLEFLDWVILILYELTALFENVRVVSGGSFSLCILRLNDCWSWMRLCVLKQILRMLWWTLWTVMVFKMWFGDVDMTFAIQTCSGMSYEEQSLC